MQRRMQAVPQHLIGNIAQQPNTVVYEPTYDTTFEPWPAERVRSCIYKLAGIARVSKSPEEARTVCLCNDELKEFSQLYQVMFKKLTDPSVVAKEENVGMFLKMVDIQDEVRKGTLSETAGKTMASDLALATLLRQSPNAPPPPADLIETLD